MSSILKALINASEKAALIARSCTGSSDDALLVAEKTKGEANARFDKDFKTIADVLAQEAAKTTIITKHPSLAKHVRGEECSEIGGQQIKIQENELKTRELLNFLVSKSLAKRMAEAAHFNVEHDLCQNLPEMPEIDAADLAVWIDPIDATAEFIAGIKDEAEPGCGLECVTVLIGAYMKSTGEPIAGVINQPFYDNGKGRVFWGVCYNGYKNWGGTSMNSLAPCKAILVSGAEDPKIIQKIKDSQYETKSVPGAGHKLMKVALGEASAYVLSKGTTFRWDTCAPHVFIKAQGGDIVDYTTDKPITYNIPYSEDNQVYCNSGGIIAYNDKQFYQHFKENMH